MALKVLYWFPRFLMILAILLMMMFSFDVFSGDETFGKQLPGFLVHNIPAFILIIALIVAWKYEIAGGIVILVLSLVMMVIFKTISGNAASLIVISPFIISGLMFILHKTLSRNKN